MKGNTTMNQRPHTEQLMLGIRSHDLRSRGCGEQRNKTLREGISPQWEDWRKILHECGWVHTRHVCYNSDFANMHERIAFRWFLHSRHSFLWISSQRESRSLWHHKGVPLSLPLSHNPTHIWKWEEGNPRWWLKGYCCQGEFSPHLFLCVCMSIRSVWLCTLPPRAEDGS